MPRQLKKYDLKLDKKTIMKQPSIIIIGFDPATNKIQLNIQGKVNFEEMIDMFNTAQLELLTTFEKSLATKEGVDMKLAKRDIYDRAVLGFSLMIDQFLPEGKLDKYAKFTDEAVMEAQNTKLKKQIQDKALKKAKTA